MTPLGWFNFLVLQWVWVRLAYEEDYCPRCGGSLVAVPATSEQEP